MASTTLVLPFGLPPAEMAPDLIRSLQAPALATLLSRNSQHAVHTFEPSRLLPHEAWLARALGLAVTAEGVESTEVREGTVIGCGRSAEVLEMRFTHPAPHDFAA